MRFSRIALAVVALTAFSGVAQAQDYKFGGQVTLSKPQGDFDTAFDGKIGFGLGGHMFIDLKGGHAIVPRIDYVMYKRSEGGAELTGNVLTLGADYNFYVNGKANEGFYLAASLGYASVKTDYTEPGFSLSETKSNLYYGAGLGYMFTPNVGAELKYNHTSFTYYGVDVTAPSMNATFIFRF